MSLYFDYKVQSPDPSGININLGWHSQHSLLAVSSYSQDKGGFVTIFDELGEPLQDITYPQHPIAQVTSLAWHPTKKILVNGWENGELQVWAGETEFSNVQSPHQMPITILEWSDEGGRLVSGDTSGSLVGWKMDSRGQILTIFHHELKDPLIHVVFRKNQQRPPGFDISGLARAAVAGDERALDMFSAWRPRTAGQRFNFHSSQGDNMCFYIGTVSGVLFYFNEEGTCTEVLNTDGSIIKKLLFHERKDNLIVMTEGLNIGQFAVDANGNLSEIMKVKLNGRSQDATMVWAGPGLLGVSTGDLSVRCWDLDTGENYLLEYQSSVTSSSSNTLPTEIFTSLDFNSQKGLLCGGTNHGNIIMWRSNPHENGLEQDSTSSSALLDPAQGWHLEAPCSVRGAVKQLCWGSSSSLLAVNTITTVYILKDQTLCAAYGQQVSAVQISPSHLLVEILGTSITGQKRHSLELKTDLQVKGVAVTSSYLAVWSSKTLVVYQFSTEGLGDDVRTTTKVLGSFSCEVESAVIFEQHLVVLGEGTIQLRTFQGTVKQSLQLTDSEGQPLGMELSGRFLTVATTNGVIKLWDLARREAKLHFHPKHLEDDIPDFGEIILARCNSSGTKVSISIAKSNFIPDPKLFLWDIESDSIQYFNFATGKLDVQEAEELQTTPVSNGSPTTKGQLQHYKEISTNPEFDCGGRFVLSHQWDAEEPKLLICEAKLLPKTSGTKDISTWSKRVSSSTITLLPDSENNQQPNNKLCEILLVTFFTTLEQGLIIQDTMPLPNYCTGVLGVQTPHYVLLKKPSEMGTKNRMVEQVTMRDFEGLEASDKATRDAVLHFSYNLSIGNMDEAFRSIKTIRSEAVWESLARMCVKTKRLDVAWVCLGHMKHARGAMALREAAKEPELEARVGMLAVQLGLVEEAEKLYTSCGRFDLLNRLYQASGEWDKALRVAEEQDRIHLRATFFNYARHLESKGDFPGAAHMYERSDTHRFQVPRMLLDDQLSLESYILKSKDPQLVKWWAQYMESTGQMDLALKYYEEAQDYFSLVRVLCFQDNLERASEVASSTGDRAACYHLARQYETMGNINEAVHFFTRAQAYGNAVRICKEQSMEEQLWNLALLAGPREQLEAAQYFESGDRPVPDKAVILYHRAGMLHKALDLAFRTQQYDALQQIAVDLNSDSDPALIQKCAQFFVENKQFAKAVDLLAVGKQYEEALNLCLEHSIQVTEDLAEKLTMAKGEGDEEMRVKILEKVAESVMAQGNYHLATKKFTQAGNKIKAMKALLKSGDTEKIIFFANVSRQREIYIMAANYLQSLDWQNSPEVLKNIVTFYTKGKAPDLLANFYVACAQVEVDEYQNYEKALGALNEASRCLAKVTNPRDQMLHERAIENLNTRMTVVRRFVDIRRQLEQGESETAFSQCRQMLQNYSDVNMDLEDVVRKGDIYALMVEYQVTKGDFQRAYQLIEEFRQSVPGVNLQYYLGSATLEKVSKGVGISFSAISSIGARNDKTTLIFSKNGSGDRHDTDDEVEEDVRDDDFSSV